MLYVPPCGFGWRFSSESGVRPANNFGTSVTPAQNAKSGAWAVVFTGAEILTDVFGIQICINSGGTSTAARDIIIDIGADPAGGTAYSITCPDLLGSSAGSLAAGVPPGIWYYFPLWIKAGSQIAARASVNNATVGTVRVWATVFGRPSNPAVLKVGQYIDAIGVVAATSKGTDVTPGTTSDGTYVSLGSHANAHWWWQVGMGCNNGTITNLAYTLDLAYGASQQHMIIEDQLVVGDTAEALGMPVYAAGRVYVPGGETIYGRSQCSGAPVTGISMIAYGMRE